MKTNMVNPMLAFDIPLMNATLNGISGVLLFAGWLMIRSNRTRAHIVLMSCALVTFDGFLGGICDKSRFERNYLF